MTAAHSPLPAVQSTDEPPTREVERNRDGTESFCVCGHLDHEHADVQSPRARYPRRCQAPDPDPCSCYGYRRSPRSL